MARPKLSKNRRDKGVRISLYSTHPFIFETRDPRPDSGLRVHVALDECMLLRVFSRRVRPLPSSGSEDLVRTIISRRSIYFAMAIEGKQNDHASLVQGPGFSLLVFKLYLVLKTRLAEAVDSPGCASTHDGFKLTWGSPFWKFFTFFIGWCRAAERAK